MTKNLNAAPRYLHKICMNERGSISIMAAVVFTILLCFTGAVVDFGVAYSKASQLQSVLDAAALAGAGNLPNTANANSVVNDCLQLNHVDPSEVDITFESGNKVITLQSNKNVPTFFLRVIGIDELKILKSASAGVQSGYSSVFDYRIFSGSTAHTLNLGGTYTIDGSVHSNGSVSMSPSRGTVTGIAEGCTSVYVNPSTATVGGVLCPAPYVAMPDFDAVVQNVMPKTYDEYAAASTYSNPTSLQTWQGSKYITGNVTVRNQVVIYGDVYINGDFIVKGGAPVCKMYGNLFVNGNISFTNDASIYGCVFATGNITFSGGGATMSPNLPVCVYSQNGNINMQTASTEATGIVYAPKGDVSIRGNILTFHGSIVGNTVSGIPANLIMNGSTQEFGFFPESTSIRLIK